MNIMNNDNFLNIDKKNLNIFSHLEAKNDH